MIAQQITTSLALRAISIADSRTADFFHFNDGAAYPVGMSIPIPAGRQGFTLLYYTRRLTGGYDFGFKYFVDSTANINGGLNSQQTEASGTFNGGFYSNGVRVRYGPGYIYDNSSWKLIALKTLPGLVHDAGRIYFNMVAGDTNPNNSPTRIDYAHILVYDRSLTEAELAAPLPPSDFAQRYTAAGYVAGQLALDDEVSGDLPALFHFR